MILWCVRENSGKGRHGTSETPGPAQLPHHGRPGHGRLRLSGCARGKGRKTGKEADFHLPAKSLGVSSRVVTDPEEEMTDNMIAEALSSKTGALLDVSSF